MGILLAYPSRQDRKRPGAGGSPGIAYVPDTAAIQDAMAIAEGTFVVWSPRSRLGLVVLLSNVHGPSHKGGAMAWVRYER